MEPWLFAAPQLPEHIVFPTQKYFKLYSKFEVVNWVSTYAAIEYQKPVIKILNFLKRLVTGSYIGLPSLVPDHILVVLKKKEGLDERSHD